MILKNNRFFGRDISNIMPTLSRNQSLQRCDKNNRKQSLSKLQPIKPSLQNIQSDKQNEEFKDITLPDLPIQMKETNQCVPDYFLDIIKYMKQIETQSIGNYCEKIINIDKSSRGETVNWIIDVHYKFKLFPQTLYLIVHIFDKYLSLKNVQKSKLKLIAVSALYMASKYEETYRVPQIKDLLNLCTYSYTKRDILQTEADIIKTLNFNLVYDSAYKFLEGLEAFSQMNKKNFHLSQYLLELAMTQSEFLEYSQSLLACSAFYLVCKIRKVQIDWDDKYFKLTSYKQGDLHKCARQLCNILQRIDKITHTSSLKKKFSEVQFHQVTRLKLQRKK